MTRTIRFLICLIAALAVIYAGTPTPKGNETKGRYYFKQTCKDCHTKGAKGGEVTPLTKTIAQWKAYFAKGKHNAGAEPLAKVMPEAQLLDVQTFLAAHAADSLQPETCGK
jgi:mono/diheme cytochrome c family protein